MDLECLVTVLASVVGRQGQTGDVKEAGAKVAHLAFFIAGAR
jgi:hypothetical protein